MGTDTKIEWCDSTINPTMGCDGCELWNLKTGVKACYAGTLTERYGGGKGWPVTFDEPVSFVERIEVALNWPDLTGTVRPGKPWLNGQPRMIFVGDMGDTFTESLPLDLLLPYMERMAASPHVWQILTKRPRRMAEFFRLAGGVPKNFWPGSTVTSNATLSRVRDLVAIEGATVRWLSIEPLLGEVDLAPWIGEYYCPSCARHYDTTAAEDECLKCAHRYVANANGNGEDCPKCDCDEYENICPGCDRSGGEMGLDHNECWRRDPGSAVGIQWVIGGFESGPTARASDVQWALDLCNQCRDAGVPFFWKQNGGVQKHKTGRLLGGAEYNGFPALEVAR